jgi:hypothetical protein
MPVIRKASLAAVLLSSGTLMLGCAQVPMADAQADQAAKGFPPPAPGNGALYVYRSGYMGVARAIDVQVVGGRTAQLASNTYIRFEGPPGPVEVDCKIGDKTGAGRLEIAEGGTRYVEVSMKIGVLMPGCDVAEVAPDQGQAAVRGGKRVAVQ